MDRLKKYSTREAKTLQHIYEFLLSNNMTKTTACFLEECRTLNMPRPSKATETRSSARPALRISKDRAASVIQSFESASRSAFMQTWDDLSDEIKQIDEYRKLTFYLHVYYTIIECKTRVNKPDICTDDDGNSEKCESSMEAFRKFLVQRGAEFSTETEFLPYFALPYVFNPMQHPSFKNLFKENRWCDSLTKRLEDFILDIAISSSITLVPGKDAQKRKVTKKNFKMLYKEYRPLNVLAAELLNALENSIRGQSINLEIILKNCNAVVESGEDNDQNLDIIDSQFDLAVYKIKLELRDGNSTKNKLLILQALRWRLTKSDNKTDTVIMIRKHDILDLNRSKADRGLMKWLTMTNGPHPLQQMISRLLNALASFHKGRRYLASSPFLLRLIVIQLISSQHFWDAITCNMLLGTLQKLSTGSRERKRMVEYGLSTWLADQLVRKSEFTGDRNKYEMYDLEYSLALFMNLCQCRSAVRDCGSRSRNLFKSFNVFMSSLDVDIMPCIAGILYNFFKNPHMIAVAKEEGLVGVIERTIENNINAYPSAIEQLVDVKNILLQNKHNNVMNLSDDDEDDDDDDEVDDEDDSGNEGESNNFDDNEDIDSLEAELDEDDPLKIQPNGEDFLANYKTINHKNNATPDQHNTNNNNSK
ncbi:Armadillo-type fold,Armadillo-like helical,LIS1 homology motif [Cinara cedri]|uniref:Armadillo-type fold,Armadillo-like helical,LIS1 homology motif n=1 Tax=Cinara cedri TaxID=506608 RepID=A0A5E4M4S8_9HEMI|nr:Armadillo-type fold,Armadillo-like helical,LIS1 homology motif [Cinara cedri]